MHHLLASGPHLAVIPTLTALAVRHFRHKQGQDDGGAELEPKHPAVKFVLGAWNEGDFSAADKHIAPASRSTPTASRSARTTAARHGHGEHRVVARARAVTCGWNSPEIGASTGSG